MLIYILASVVRETLIQSGARHLDEDSTSSTLIRDNAAPGLISVSLTFSNVVYSFYIFGEMGLVHRNVYAF